MGAEYPSQQPMRISDKIKVFTQSAFRVEWIIIVGLILIITIFIVVIYKMGKTPGAFTDMVAGKLLDQLNTLEGALIAWGTQIISAITAKIRASIEK